jgi:hypothetical protein
MSSLWTIGAAINAGVSLMGVAHHDWTLLLIALGGSVVLGLTRIALDT